VLRLSTTATVGHSDATHAGLSTPLDGAELMAHGRSLPRTRQFIDGFETADGVVASLARMIAARDPATAQHCQRVAMAAVELGYRLGLGRNDLDVLHKGGQLHDIGKVGIPDAILLKQGRLTAAEWQVMKQHAAIGDAVCGELQSLAPLRPIVRHHHELLDGTGYPDGLAGNDVPLLAQIIGIADVFDALTCERPYRQAWSAERALEQLHAEVKKGWRDASLVATFAAVVESSVMEAAESWLRAA
jgi:putative two-component system response regulator